MDAEVRQGITAWAVIIGLVWFASGEPLPRPQTVVKWALILASSGYVFLYIFR